MPDSRSRFRLKLWQLLAACVVVAFVVPVGAQDSIKDLRDRREDTQEEIKAELAKIDLLEAELEEVDALIRQTSELISAQEARVALARQELKAAEEEVVRREEAARHAAEQIPITEAAIRVRMVDAYVGTAGAPEDWLDSRDLNSIAVKQAYLEFAAGSERDLLDDLRTLRAALHEHLLAGEAARQEATRLRAEVEEELRQLDELKREQQDRQGELENRKGQHRDEIERLERVSQEFTKLILQKQAEIAGVAGDPSAQGYRRPVNGGRISSEFGNRIHPIFRVSRHHAGIDIALPTGSPIFASREGRVIFVGERGGYGKTVIIRHAGPYATLYAHMSAYDVSEGSWVEGGERIGDVGNTGWSTGPHLHFEIRKDGVPINPRCCVDF